MLSNENNYLPLYENIAILLSKINKHEHDINEYGLLYFITIEEFYRYFYFTVFSQYQKETYGEVNTPYTISKELVSFVPWNKWTNKHNLPTIVDSGAGIGYISAVLVKYIFSLYNKEDENQIEASKREKWVLLIKKITLVELNHHNCQILRLFFGRHCCIINGNYLNYFPSLHGEKYDIVIGNPPFNVNGSIKVPSNSIKNKKEDGKTIWREFITHSLDYCLVDGGFLCYYIPSLWMKKDDKTELFNTILYDNKLLKSKCYSNTASNMLFKGHAQTHCGCFLIQKGGITEDFQHFSWYLNTFSRCTLSKRGTIRSLCVLDCNIERKVIYKFKEVFMKHNLDYNQLIIDKTSTLSKNISISKHQSDVYSYKNIQTCVFGYDGNPVLKLEYSDEPCPFFGKPKIICAHGMYGIPFIDKKGEYGISRRDKYIILEKNIENIDFMAWFLTTPLTLFMFENYKYRMCFLEKSGFEWLVDVSQLVKYGFTIGDVGKMYQWFDFDEKEINYLNTFSRKQILS